MESRSYRFISDPDHKENLSGRVRAACLTCRRKKIKCDGEVPCQTCKEKGVRCEGLTERKRPCRGPDRRKSQDAPNWSNQIDAPTQSTRKRPSPDATSVRGGTGQASNHSKRPEVVRINTLGSDSSISSGHHSKLNEWAESLDSHPQTVDVSANAYVNSVSTSPYDMCNINWNLASTPNMSNYAGSDVLSNDAGLSNQLPDETTKWQEPSDSVSWPPDNYSNQHTSELLSTAKMLEVHAQSLRWLASEQQVQNFNNTPRQPVAVPLQSDVYNDFNGPSISSKGTCDDLSIDDMAMVIERLPSSGFTASASHHPNAWLDQGSAVWKVPGQAGT